MSEEALDDVPWNDERGISSIRPTLELFQSQCWGNSWDGVERVIMGYPEAHRQKPSWTELNWTKPRWTMARQTLRNRDRRTDRQTVCETKNRTKWGQCRSLVKRSATLRASLFGTFLQTLPDLVTPLKGHSLSPRSCPATRSAPSERVRY